MPFLTSCPVTKGRSWLGQAKCPQPPHTSFLLPLPGFKLNESPSAQNMLPPPPGLLACFCKICEETVAGLGLGLPQRHLLVDEVPHFYNSKDASQPQDPRRTRTSGCGASPSTRASTAKWSDASLRLISASRRSGMSFQHLLFDMT